MTFILNAFHEGGVFMYFILLFGVMSFGLMAERIRTLYFNYTETPADFRTNLLNYLHRNDMTGAETYAQTVGAGSIAAKVAAVGIKIRTEGGSEEELQARMDEKLTIETNKVDKLTGFLAMFGNVSTLLGLLGTITGMIRSFAGVASANPADRATMLSKGISEAMNCTAFGLIVAIPALVAYAFLQNRTDKIVASITSATTEIFNDLLFLVDGRTSNNAIASKSDARTAASSMTV
ncbi:MAG: MotA/TolQ/ExbB proton channel family protein [Bdellovibrionales bacterium]|nr:MotA/TolQ/ExbB proton channel family protein [Bdellovibrionales bacterium]